MGYIRKMLVRGIERYYWIVSKRNGKKSGGNGKVTKVTYFLGSHHSTLYNPKYLSWYVWNNDIKLDGFLEGIVLFHLKKEGLKGLVFYSMKEGKIYFEKANQDVIVDLRSKAIKCLKMVIDLQVKVARESVEKLEEEISDMTGWLRTFKEHSEESRRITKDGYDMDIVNLMLDSAKSCHDFAVSKLDSILERQVPKPQQKDARQKIWNYCLRKSGLTIKHFLS